MKLLSGILVSSCVVSALAVATFNWTDCSDVQHQIIKVTHFDISPKPVSVPGNITFSIVGDIKHQLPANSHYSLRVKMDKELLSHWHKVPCNHNVGTCNYDDPCEFLQSFAKNHTCPQAFINNGLSCTCPFNPVKLNVQSATVQVNSIPAQWDFLATGDFRARVEILSSNTMIGCFEAKLSIKTPCVGFLCGGK